VERRGGRGCCRARRGAEGVEAFSLSLPELADDVGEHPALGLGPRRVHHPLDRRLPARAQHPLADKPVLRRVHQRPGVARVGDVLGEEGAQALVVPFPNARTPSSRQTFPTWALRVAGRRR
jgi:hypothetical protein